jgi:hypothetical protein
MPPQSVVYHQNVIRVQVKLVFLIADELIMCRFRLEGICLYTSNVVSERSIDWELSINAVRLDFIIPVRKMRELPPEFLTLRMGGNQSFFFKKKRRS